MKPSAAERAWERHILATPLGSEFTPRGVFLAGFADGARRNRLPTASAMATPNNPYTLQEWERILAAIRRKRRG